MGDYFDQQSIVEEITLDVRPWWFRRSNSMLGCGLTTPQDYPEWSGFGRQREREWVTSGNRPRDKSGEPTHAHLRDWQ
jgi:hypothetical protein